MIRERERNRRNLLYIPPQLCDDEPSVKIPVPIEAWAEPAIHASSKRRKLHTFSMVRWFTDSPRIIAPWWRLLPLHLRAPPPLPSPIFILLARFKHRRRWGREGGEGNFSIPALLIFVQTFSNSLFLPLERLITIRIINVTYLSRLFE